MMQSSVIVWYVSKYDPRDFNTFSIFVLIKIFKTVSKILSITLNIHYYYS